MKFLLEGLSDDVQLVVALEWPASNCAAARAEANGMFTGADFWAGIALPLVVAAAVSMFARFCASGAKKRPTIVRCSAGRRSPSAGRPATLCSLAGRGCRRPTPLTGSCRSRSAGRRCHARRVRAHSAARPIALERRLRDCRHRAARPPARQSAATVSRPHADRSSDDRRTRHRLGRNARSARPAVAMRLQSHPAGRVHSRRARAAALR